MDSQSKGQDPIAYRKHDNKFLNRKMIMHNVINQLNDDEDEGNCTNSSVLYGEPKRMFEIFDLMKSIAQSQCPNKYVNRNWLDLAIDLFYVLHKGNIFRYEEPLDNMQFEWIKSILTDCQKHVKTITLFPLRTNELADFDQDERLESTCNADGDIVRNLLLQGRSYFLGIVYHYMLYYAFFQAAGYCNGTTKEGKCKEVPVHVSAHKHLHYVPDVAWNIVDLIQVACFKQFNESYRIFHVLEQASETLFTMQIKNLW